MSFLGFEKKKEEETKTPSCACSCTKAQEKEADVSCCCASGSKGTESCNNNEGILNIKVLGAGCKSCHEQYENVKSAVANMGLPVEVEYITDMEKVMSYGVMSMPAITVNEKVVCMGKVLKTADVETLLRKLGQ